MSEEVRGNEYVLEILSGGDSTIVPLFLTGTEMATLKYIAFSIEQWSHLDGTQVAVHIYEEDGETEVSF